MCGDSTNPDHVCQLFDGARASLLFTSPPYGSQRDYTTGGIGDWDVLMQGVFGTLNDVMIDDGQVLVNLGLIHKDGEWWPYWDGWVEWMRTQGWRRFGLYVWDQGPGLPGDWNGRLAPSFEFVFHFNQEARKPNKIVPCSNAGSLLGGVGLRDKTGKLSGKTGAGRPIQDYRIPDSVIRVNRHAGGIPGGKHPAIFPVKLVEFVMMSFSQENDIVYEPFAGSGTSLIAGHRTNRSVRAMEIAPEYVETIMRRFEDVVPNAFIRQVS